MASDYCTAADVKGWLQVTDVADDTLLGTIVTATSRWIEGWCGRRFWVDAAPTVRTYQANNRYQLSVDDISTSTGVVIKTDPSGAGTFGAAWLGSDFQLLPPNAPSDLPEAKPYTAVRAVGVQTFALPYTALLARADRVQVTAAFGWPAVPVDVKLACIMMSARRFKRRYSPEGVAGFGDMGAVRVQKDDVDVTALLRPYRKGTTVVAFA